MLLHLYCSMRCQGRLVAAALSFYPPSPPLYSIEGWRSGTASAASSRNNKIRYKSFKMLLDSRVQDVGITPEVVRVKTRSGNYLAVGIYRHPEAHMAIIYSHGNAVDLGSLHTVAALICQECKCTVVTYDYSGYGESTGSPSEKETYRDIQAVYDYVQEMGIVEDVGTQLVLYGESIGSGPAIWLGARHKNAGLILHAPIASGLRVLTENRLLCCCDIFPNIDRIKSVKSPVFIIHGERDRNVKIDHGKRLHERLRGIAATFEPWWVEGAGHNNIQGSKTDEYLERVSSFLKFLDEGASGRKNKSDTNRDPVSGVRDSAVGASKDVGVTTIGLPYTGKKQASAVHPTSHADNM